MIINATKEEIDLIVAQASLELGETRGSARGKPRNKLEEYRKNSETRCFAFGMRFPCEFVPFSRPAS